MLYFNNASICFFSVFNTILTGAQLQAFSMHLFPSNIPGPNLSGHSRAQKNKIMKISRASVPTGSRHRAAEEGRDLHSLTHRLLHYSHVIDGGDAA